MKIAVAGAGAFGTGLAIALCGKGPIGLFGRDRLGVDHMIHKRENKARLPGITLPADILPSADPAILATADVALLCIPTQKLSGFLMENHQHLDRKPVIACCKGIDLMSLDGPADMIARTLPQATAGMLTGPSFAQDIARRLPTALTLASADSSVAEDLQRILTRPTLRIYRSADVTGAQLGGALKNVGAIAAGACSGAGLGESARAALVTRGYAEMQKIAAILGAQPETLMGLSGLGDVMLTCGSPQSRNFSLGLSIGRGDMFDPGVTVEGAATAQAVVRIAKDRDLDLPVSTAVHDLVTGQRNVAEVLGTLLSRPLREE